MADIQAYVTVKTTYVPASIVRCAMQGCSKDANVKNKVDAIALTDTTTDQLGTELAVTLYVCDKCLEQIKNPRIDPYQTQPLNSPYFYTRINDPEFISPGYRLSPEIWEPEAK